MRAIFRGLIVFAILALGLAGCQTATPTATPAAVATQTPIAAAQADPTPASAESPTATAPPAATSTVSSSVSAETKPTPPAASSPIFDLAWDDRTPFAAGLIPAEQAILDDLLGASVYHMRLALADSLTSLTGQVAIRYTNQEDAALDAVLLRLFPNLADGSSTITAITVDGEPVTPAYSLEASVLAAPLPAKLAPGASTVLEIAFDVTIPTDRGGNYGTFAYRDDVLALAHFYPMVAVFDDEGWNVEIAPPSGDVVYAESSFYLVELDAPADLVVAASGVEIGRNNSGDRQTITYAAGPMRDFYIAASPRFQSVSTQVGETTITSYAFPEHVDANNQVLQIAADAVRSFNQRFGVYPFTELDLASTPTDALGVEYPGIVVNALRMYDPATSPYPPVYLESTTAHEVAHQWFYSLVGNDQLDEPWVDESVTQYATMMYFLDTAGEPGRDGFRDSLVDRWSRTDNADIPIGLPVAAYAPFEYGAIVYGRGPLFVEALAQTMGQTQFEAFMRAYVAENRYGIATTESFQQQAEAACGCNLTDLFNEWVLP